MIKYERISGDLLSRMPAAREILLADDNVVFAYLFGSRAAGTGKPLSDLDIAVSVRDTSNAAEYKLDLFDRLSKALGTSEIDLVVLNAAPVSLAGRVLQQKQVLVDKEPGRRHAYESLTLREFFDFRVKEEAYFGRRYGVGR